MAVLLSEDFSRYNSAVVVGSAPEFCTDTCKLGSTIFGATFPTPIVLRKTTDNGGSWSSEVTVEASGFSHCYCDADGSDDVWISYHNSGRNAVYCRRYTVSTTTLGSRVTIASGLTAARDPKILRVSGTGATATLLCFFASDDGGGNWVVSCYESTDGGATWASKSTVHTESKTGLDSIEDLDAIVAGNGDILVAWEREVTEKGAASCRQRISTDGGSTWGSESTIVDNAGADDEGGHYFLDSNGDIGAADDLFYVYGSDKDTGTTYDKNQLFRLQSTDDGATWGSEVKIWESHSNVEPVGEIDGNGDMLLLVTKQYDPASSTSLQELIAFHAVESTDDDWSEGGWTQDDGLAYVVADVGGEITARVEGVPRTTTRAFLSHTLPSAAETITLKMRTSVTPDIRFCFHYQDKNNHYLLALLGVGVNESQVYKRVSGTYTLLDNVAFTPAADTWYDVEILLGGSPNIIVKIDTVTYNSFNDSTYTSGGIALAGSASANRQTSLFAGLTATDSKATGVAAWRRFRPRRVRAFDRARPVRRPRALPFLYSASGAIEPLTSGEIGRPAGDYRRILRPVRQPRILRPDGDYRRILKPIEQ